MKELNKKELNDINAGEQVNAGYENPEIICVGSTCSGV